MAAAAVGLRACPLWAHAADQQSAAAKAGGPKGDAFVYFVGGRGSGKTTLLNRVLNPSRAEVPAPSGSLDYTYARGGGGGGSSGGSSGGGERSGLAHFWELGGQEGAGLELARSEHTFLTFKQVTSAVVVICLDLSDPASVLPCAEQWLAAVRSKLGATYAAFERKGLQLPEQLRQRARLRLAAAPEDRDAVDVTGISLVLAATKWDAFRGRAAEQQRALGLALRCLAHANGAHLAYLGGLQPGGGAGAEGGRQGAGGASDAAQAAALGGFVRLINHLAFVGLDKKLSTKAPPQTGHLSPLVVPAGADRLQDIGRPGGGPLRPLAGAAFTPAEMAAAVQEWRSAAAALFPAPAAGPRHQDAGAGAARRLVEGGRYADEGVDAARARWHEALGLPPGGGAGGAGASAPEGGGGGPSASGGARERARQERAPATTQQAAARPEALPPQQATVAAAAVMAERRPAAVPASSSAAAAANRLRRTAGGAGSGGGALAAAGGQV